MITRAVFSYFNAEESFSNKAGFRYYADFLYTMALVTHLAQRHFKTIQVVTTSWGAKVLQEAGVSATEYSVALDDMKSTSKWFWAHGKLIAYNLQTQPFVHVDNDVFLWRPLPQRVLNAELCFQSKEFFGRPDYKWYQVLKPCWNAAPVRPQIIANNEVTDFTYNCGICGGYNLEFFKEWQRCSDEYIFAPENQQLFFDEFHLILMHQNLWHEQYFAASLIQAHDLRSRVELLADDITDPAWKLTNKAEGNYTHLWGGIKQNQINMKKVRMRLYQEAPVIYEQVTAFVNKYLFSECQKDVMATMVR